MSRLAELGELWRTLQTWLFPRLEDELGALDAQHLEFVAVCELCAPQNHLTAYRWCGNGCPPKDRLPLCKAFIAKAVWDFPTTRDLLDALRHRPTLRRLCGWETLGEVPSEATFSRAFACFAKADLARLLHAAMIKQHYGDKLVGHLSRDSTAIHARERAVAKPPKPPKAPRRRGRRPAGVPPPPPALTKLQQQLDRSLAENLADLPTACAWGCKQNSQGKTECWRGYKLHLDSIDGEIPLNWLLTGADPHDSQAAIPLAQQSATRVTNLYDLMDAAYDAAPIRALSARLGHVALIDHNPRGGEKRQFAPAEQVRYRERSTAERVNSHLHDSHGGRHVRVRGPVKVLAHLSFGLLVIAAEQLLKLLG